jgi:hypothetical protein
MTREPDFHDLVGQDLPRDEEARLRRAHDLLVAAGPIPELPAGLEEPSLGERPSRREQNIYELLPRRRTGAALALAAAIALVAFVGGYVAGFRHNGFSAQYAVPMHGVSGLASASAQIKIGSRDSHGNLPLRLDVKGLPRLEHGYYEMFLTRGNHMWTCGTFAGAGSKTVKVRLNIPYQLERGDGWVIVKEERPGRPMPGQTVLTT